MSDDSDGYYEDDWPSLTDGTAYNGKDLLKLVGEGKSPFKNDWDVELLLKEVESVLKGKVHDIVIVTKGSNNYGIHMVLSDGRHVVARVGRADVNTPNYQGFDVPWLVSDVEFEAAIYQLLRERPAIKPSALLYHRAPVQFPNPNLNKPDHILGRRLLLYARAAGNNNVWKKLDHDDKMSLLTQAAHIRAALFHFDVPQELAQTWLLERLGKPRPDALPNPVTPTRQFCVDLLSSKVTATIGELGTMIGCESDNEVVGPIAFAARTPLSRLIPHILPVDDENGTLYRLVIEHGDFGIHNMSIESTEQGPRITSLYDWETACIVPAILSNTIMSVTIDLIVDSEALPTTTRVDENSTEEELKESQLHSADYHKVLFEQVPDYRKAIKAGKDARYLWFTISEWRGGDSEQFFGALGTWAEKRLEQLGVN